MQIYIVFPNIHSQKYSDRAQRRRPQGSLILPVVVDVVCLLDGDRLGIGCSVGLRTAGNCEGTAYTLAEAQNSQKDSVSCIYCLLWQGPEMRNTREREGIEQGTWVRVSEFGSLQDSLCPGQNSPKQMSSKFTLLLCAQ